MNSELFVKRITLERDKIEDFNIYPFNIEVLKNMNEVNLTKPVTFLIGENGVGKSTLIEALAIQLGLNAEGGSQNFNFSTQNTHSNLCKYLRVSTFNKLAVIFMNVHMGNHL